MKNRPLAALFLALLLPASASAKLPPDMDQYLLEGINAIYRMQFDKAAELSNKAMAIIPGHPYPYFGLAGIAWTQYVYGTDQSDQTLLKPFDAKIQDVIKIANKWIKTHPQDPEALMVMGAAYGISSRLMVIRHEWLSAYFEGRRALAATRASIKADPNFYDAYLGIGMYDYYSDLYPNFVGVLAKIMLRGNRLRGIETLKMVAEKGHFSQDNAKILLVEIYTEDPFGARDPEKAVAIMKELRAKFPESAMMHSAQLVALYESKRYDEVVTGARDYLARGQRGFYTPIESGKGNVALGCGLWALGRKPEALDAFRAAEGVLYNGKPSRWAVWAHIRAGELEDSMGMRKEAVADYKAAIAEPDLWEMRKIAKAYLSKPFSADHPGPIPPL